MSELFRRFNRKDVDDRTVDTLIGLSMGLVADGKVVQSEAECLMAWLVQAKQRTDVPIVANLFDKVSSMFEDGVVDRDECEELFGILRKVTGDPSEIGELTKTTNLPVESPEPEVIFQGKSFLFTGTFAFGVRKKCQGATLALGGHVAKSVNKSLNYLVLGTYVTDTWAHENYGRKIEKAIQYQQSGVPIQIVTEERWADCGGICVG